MSWDDHEPADSFAVHAGALSARLHRVALDMNVALSDADGLVRARLERAISGLDQTLREMGLLAAGRLRLGEGGTGRRQG